MPAQTRRARVEDVHRLARDMPHVTVEHGPQGNPVYQVGRKSFVFFRTPRPDAVDPETGERYTDVIMFWVPSDLQIHPTPVTELPGLVAFTDFEDPWGNRLGFYEDLAPSGQQPEPGGSVRDESMFTQRQRPSDQI